MANGSDDAIELNWIKICQQIEDKWLNLKKCDEQTNGRTNEQTDLCIELRYAQLKMEYAIFFATEHISCNKWTHRNSMSCQVCSAAFCLQRPSLLLRAPRMGRGTRRAGRNCSASEPAVWPPLQSTLGHNLRQYVGKFYAFKIVVPVVVKWL